MHLVATSSTQTQTLAAEDEHCEIAMASSSEHPEKKRSSSTRSGGHRAAESKERREKGKRQGSHPQGGAKKPSKKNQATVGAGGRGKVKGRSKSAQANEISEGTMDPT